MTVKGKSTNAAGSAQAADEAAAQAAEDSHDEASEDQNTSGGESSNGEQPNPPVGAGTDDRNASDGEGDTGDAKPDAALKRENQNLRRRLREAEAKLEDGENANLSELERTVKDRDKWRTDYEKLEGSLKRERLTARAMELAGKLGAIEPSAVAKLISADAVEWDNDPKDGLKPMNVDELVAGVKKDHPRLFSAAPGRGNGGDRDAKPTNSASSPTERMRNAYASKR